MIGAILGDIIGSQYEGTRPSSLEFPLFTRHCRFTDDTILTCAVADALKNNLDFGENFRRFYGLYPHVGYGGGFIEWAEGRGHSNSYGNGAVMRISPVGYLETEEEVDQKAIEATSTSHNHPTSLASARTVARAIWAARQTDRIVAKKLAVRSKFLQMRWRIVEVPVHAYGFYSAQSTTSIAISVIMNTDSWEESVRLAVSLGGDTDTLTAVVGSLAEPIWGIPEKIKKEGLTYLDDYLRGIIASTNT